MAATTLYDFYKRKGQSLPSVSERSKLYESYGLGSSGAYAGTAEQNTALLGKLSTAPQVQVPPAPVQSATNALGTLGLDNNQFLVNRPQPTPTAPPQPAPQQAPQVNIPPVAIKPEASPARTVRQPTYRQFTNPNGTVVYERTNPNGSIDQSTTPFQTPVMGADGLPVANVVGKENLIPIGQNPTTAAGALSALGLENLPSEEDIYKRVLASPEFGLVAERLGAKATESTAVAEAAKAQAEEKYAADKTELEQKLASRGLAFSGVRATQVQALAENLASSKLKADRELASKLLEQDFDLREKTMNSVKAIITQAQDGRKSAIQQLNAVGLAVIGDQLVPTMTARKEEQSQVNFERVQERLEAAANEPAVSERLRAAKITALAKAGRALRTKLSPEGDVDPVLYVRLRNDYVNAIGDVSEYDEVFAPMLSILERNKLGVGKTTF